MLQHFCELGAIRGYLVVQLVVTEIAYLLLDEEAY